MQSSQVSTQTACLMEAQREGHLNNKLNEPGGLHVDFIL